MATKPDLSAKYDALFKVREGETPIAGALRMVDIDRIAIEAQPRRAEHIDAEKLDELAESISEMRKAGSGIEGTGLLQPPLVRAAPGADDVRYILIAGERRVRAVKLLQQRRHWDATGLPVLVVAESDVTRVRLMQIVENVQRENLNPLDEARGIQELQQAWKLSIRALAHRLGKSVGYIDDRLALVRAPQDVQDVVSARSDTMKIARNLSSVKDETKRRELGARIQAGASRRAIETEIDTLAASGITVNRKPISTPVTAHLSLPPHKRGDEMLEHLFAAQLALDKYFEVAETGAPSARQFSEIDKRIGAVESRIVTIRQQFAGSKQLRKTG